MKILSEPYVIPSFRGLVPVVDTDQGKPLYIAAKSLMVPLMKLVMLNGNKWTGIEADITKLSDGKMSPYVVSSPLLNEESSASSIDMKSLLERNIIKQDTSRKAL
jgi:hypothetical protein